MSQYRHIKTGGVYQVLATGALQTDTPLADMAEVVLYRGLDGRHWVRPKAEFEVRFEPLAPESIKDATIHRDGEQIGRATGDWDEHNATPFMRALAAGDPVAQRRADEMRAEPLVITAAGDHPFGIGDGFACDVDDGRQLLLDGTFTLAQMERLVEWMRGR